MHRSVFRQLANRPAASHKYDFGHVLVIGGSTGMVGAPLLSAMAAMRTGAGLVTIASSPPVINKLEKRVVEIMTLPLPEDSILDKLGKFIDERKVNVIVVGPGMKPNFATLVLQAIAVSCVPVVVDGGALSVIAKNPETIQHNFILTPHQGEFQRFFNHSLPKDPSKLRKAAADFATKNKVILVLKGNPSYICGPDGQIYKNTSGGPALATAGTGDVLTGVIAGMVAQKINPLAAVKAAVYLHGVAGKLASEAKTEPGVIASDVVETLPAALKLVLSGELYDT